MSLFENLLSFNKRNKEENTNNESTYYLSGPPCALDYSFLRRSVSSDPLSVPAFFSCLNLIKRTISSLPIEVERVGRKGVVSTVQNHPIKLAFEGGLVSKTDLFSRLVEDVVLKGNAFCYVRRSQTGTVLEIEYLRDCSVIYNEQTSELVYMAPKIGSGAIEPINILHFKMHSRDGVNGIPLYHFAKRSIAIAAAADQQARNFYENGCNLTGYLKTKASTINERQKLEIKKNWQEVNGPGSKGGIAVLPADMDFIPLSLNSADSQLLETRHYNAVDICRFFNIPPVFIGETGGATYSTPENEQTAFLNNCILPWINMFEDEINRKLVIGENIRVILNEESLLRSDKKSQAEYYTKLVSSGILSINEVREELGFPNIGEEGDKHIIPFTDINQNSIESNGEGSEKSESGNDSERGEENN